MLTIKCLKSFNISSRRTPNNAKIKMNHIFFKCGYSEFAHLKNVSVDLLSHVVSESHGHTGHSHCFSSLVQLKNISKTGSVAFPGSIDASCRICRTAGVSYSLQSSFCHQISTVSMHRNWDQAWDTE